ncbi:hypothetical protein [Luteimonas sp. gir]|uniref:hypothetical protein n=1 Tax=Luteimonas sp. gir TaxID=3127960 RepID=UPI003075B540
MIQLIPYRSVNGLLLGDYVDRAKELFGDPVVERRDGSGNLIEQYRSLILVFQKETLRLQECEVQCGVKTQVNGRDLDWSLPGLKALCEEDGDPQEYYGSVILFKIGIVMSGVGEGAESDRTIGIFLRDVWADLRPKMKPFTLS